MEEIKRLCPIRNEANESDLGIRTRKLKNCIIFLGLLLPLVEYEFVYTGCGEEWEDEDREDYDEPLFDLWEYATNLALDDTVSCAAWKNNVALMYLEVKDRVIDSAKGGLDKLMAKIFVRESTKREFEEAVKQ